MMGWHMVMLVKQCHKPSSSSAFSIGGWVSIPSHWCYFFVGFWHVFHPIIIWFSWDNMGLTKFSYMFRWADNIRWDMGSGGFPVENPSSHGWPWLSLGNPPCKKHMCHWTITILCWATKKTCFFSGTKHRSKTAEEWGRGFLGHAPTYPRRTMTS